jgi:hypothetical protein
MSKEWCNGAITMPVPVRTRDVRAASAAANVSGWGR